MYRVMSLTGMQSISFSHLTVSEKKTFNIYTENKVTFFAAPATKQHHQARAGHTCSLYLPGDTLDPIWQTQGSNTRPTD